jgi:hypothetical protein
MGGNEQRSPGWFIPGRHRRRSRVVHVSELITGQRRTASTSVGWILQKATKLTKVRKRLDGLKCMVGLGVTQNGADLFSGNPGEPLEEILDACAALRILKKSPNRNTGSFKNPSAAYLFR